MSSYETACRYFDDAARLLDLIGAIGFGERVELRIGIALLRRKRHRKTGSDEDRRFAHGSPHRRFPSFGDQSGFFATPTMAGRSRRSLII